MSIRKTPLQQAIIEAKEIEKVAYESARKALEETISPKIEQAVKESLMELEKETTAPVTEAVKIEVTPEGAITVTSDEGAEKLDTGIEASTESPSIETPELGTDKEDSNTETPNTEINMGENEEMYEVEAGSNVPEAPTEAPAEAPAMDIPAEAPVDAPVETPAASSPNPFDAIEQKLDTILTKLGTEETPGQGTEGEVEIVDDETAQAPTEAPAPAGAEAPAPVTEMGGMEDEDVVYELDGEEEGFVRETDGKMFDEMSDLEEIEIVDEDKEKEGDELEEDSLMRRHRAGQRGKIGEIPLGKVSTHSDHATSLKENKNITAQKESKMDELKQENESLKKTIKEYKESFVVLRKQINEVQVFNAKLAYANKLFINGGLKNEEKVRIAEEFDKVSTVEDAKKLYNNLLKEVSEVKTVKVAPEEKLKSVKPSVQQPSEKSQTLYESDEMKRMKQLAGIL